VAGFPCIFCSIPRCEGKRNGLLPLLLSGYCCGSANRITPIALFSRHLCTCKVRINIIHTGWLQMSRQFGMIVISLFGTHMEYFLTTKQRPSIQLSIFKQLFVLSSFPYLFSVENYKPSKWPLIQSHPVQCVQEINGLFSQCLTEYITYYQYCIREVNE